MKWKMYEYKNYEEYVAAQDRGCRQKLHSHAGTGPEVITEIKKRIPSALNILCHGTRGGQEQAFFKEQYQLAYIIGTEISTTANRIPNTVQWDFSVPKTHWIKCFDIVYSNAFDHSITPEETLEVWMNQLTDSGSLILEMHIADKTGWEPNPTAPFAYQRQDIIDLIESKNYKIVDEWPSPKFGSGKYKWGRPTIQVRK